jgi:hypothetical protein
MMGATEFCPPALPAGPLLDEPEAGRAARVPATSLAITETSFFLPFHEVNQRCIELLVDASNTRRELVGGLVSDLHDLLQTISPLELRRAAQRAFFLVDLQFGDVQWWAAGGVATDLHAPRHPAGQIYFQRIQATRLARATLTLAWHSVRSDQRNAHVVLGMTEGVAGAIAKLRFEEIDRIAERRSKYIRPRWSDRPGVWREILSGRSESSQRDADLHGVQLIAGELLARRTRL